jgi:hypothetical protein
MEAVARSVLSEAGFELREGVPSTGLPPGARVWVGERGLRRKGITASTAVVPIIVVFVAGSILGGLDAYIVGSPLVGVGWVLGAAAISGLFWLVYGGTYDSDVVMLTSAATEPGPASPAGSVSAVLWAARIRSQIRADLRVPTVVSGPLKLAGEVGALARKLERKLSASAGDTSGATRGAG